MIKRLRRKFICINMVIVTIMLIFIFGLTLNLTQSAMEEDGLELLRSAVAPDKKDEGKQNPPAEPDGGKKNKEPKPTAGEGFQQGAPAETGKQNPPAEPDKKHSRLPTFTLQYNETGTLVAQGSDFYDLTDTAYLQEILDAAIATGKESGVLSSQSLRFLKANFSGRDLYIFADISQERATMHNLVVDVLFISALAFLAFLLISVFLSFWAVKPVERAWMQQQQFIADASHELKTPLTVILTNAELMCDNTLPEEEQKECAGHILDMSQRMRNLTEEMLTLARAENAQEGLMKELCPVDQILDDAVLSFEALFFEQGLELQADLAEGIRVKGNETQLRQLAEILLDNARKYSLPGEVNLQLRKNNCRSCTISLSNPAQPLSKEALEHLFERFYRVDEARSSDGSFGLGLSIAEGIVKRHGGSIGAEYKDGRITFTAQLPTA